MLKGGDETFGLISDQKFRAVIVLYSEKQLKDIKILLTL